MLCVCVPHGSVEKEQSVIPESDREGTNRVGSVEHHLCGVGSLLLAVGFAVLFYPLLVALALPLEALATTALVSAVVLVWSVGWVGFELLWEWRSGRWSR